MAGFLEYSTTPGSNTAINSIGIQGSDAVLNFDNGLRQLMADAASQISRYVTKSSGYTALKADYNQLIEFTASATLSLTEAATLTDGWSCIVKANGGDVTIDPASSEQIDGANTKTVSDGTFAFVFCDGSAFHTVSLPQVLLDISGLAVTDGNFIVGDGTNFVAESGATARASLGVTIGTHVQAAGDVLDDLNTLGASTADGEFLVATGAGTLAWESGSTARASLGLGDAALETIGTSGSTVPKLDGANTWSDVQTVDVSGEGIILKSSNTGKGGCWTSFDDDVGTRLGYVGCGSALTGDMYLVCDNDDIRIVSGGDVFVTGDTTITGTLTVTG